MQLEQSLTQLLRTEQFYFPFPYKAMLLLDIVYYNLFKQIL